MTARTRKRAMVVLISAVAAGLAVWAAIGLGVRVQDAVEQDQIFERLRKTSLAKAVTDLGSGRPQRGEEEVSLSSAASGHDIAALREENPDCIGWISIEGTVLDYPVMQTVEEPEYYLKRNFDGEHNDHGVPFLDARCHVGTADHLIIYGHNMADGTMFSVLHKYAQKSYWEEHPVITFETVEGVSQYRVAAVMRVSGVAYETQWSIYNCISLNDVELEEMVEQLSQGALYHTGVVPVYGDELLTVSTCESLYSQSNDRLVVVAVKQ